MVKQQVKETPEKKWCKTAILGFIIPILGLSISSFLSFSLRYVLIPIERIIYSFVFEAGSLLVGLILSIIALRKIKHTPNLKGRIFALLGLIISIVIIIHLIIVGPAWIKVIRSPWVVISPPHAPLKCAIGADFSCVEYSASKDGTLKLTLRNTLGEDIYHADFNMDDCTRETDDWKKGEDWSITCQVTLPEEGGRKRFKINYTMWNQGFPHLNEGEIYISEADIKMLKIRDVSWHS